MIKKQKQMLLLASIALIVGVISFTYVKYTSDNKKAKAELDSYYNSSQKDYPQYVVISDGVKLRLDPDTSAKEVATLKTGSVVDVIKRSDVVTKVGSKEGYWYNVKFGDKYGWVFEDFVMPKDKVSTVLPQNYYSYIKGLSPNDVKSVSLALSKFKSAATIITGQNTRDDMFRKFRDLYNNVLKSNQETYFNQSDSILMQSYYNSHISGNSTNVGWNAVLDSLNTGDGIDDQSLKDKIAALRSNGFRVSSEEGSFYVTEDPTFLSSNFSSYISGSIKDFLSLRSKDLKEGYSTDASLVITWDQLGDRIAAWESYTKKYTSNLESSEASKSLKNYIHTYFYGMDNSPAFRNARLNSDLQKSYERFMQKYQDSSYYPTIRNYYNMLSNNNFNQTSQAVGFLKSSGIN